MNKLLPCPFCGWTIIKHTNFYLKGYVACQNAQCPICDVPMSKKWWNTRDGTDEKQKKTPAVNRG